MRKGQISDKMPHFKYSLLMCIPMVDNLEVNHEIRWPEVAGACQVIAAIRFY